MCLSKLSRRALLVGTSTAPIVVVGVAGLEDDPIIFACQQWLDVEAERNRLTTEWGRYEEFLARQFNWYRLSQAEQAAVPEGALLDKIGKQLEMLDWESDALLKALPSTPATCIAAVAANLSVAGSLLYPDDHPEVHGLIVRAVRDLKALNLRT